MTTYYVRTDGSNANAGTADSAAGAWADPGYAAATMSDGDICYIKAGTYTLSTTTPGAGGPVVPTANTTFALIGYETTATDGCPTNNRPIIDAGVQTGIALVTLDGADAKKQTIANLKLDGQSGTGTVGVNGSGENDCFVVNCEAVDMGGDGFESVFAIGCKAAGCGSEGFFQCVSVSCWSDQNSVGFEGVNSKAFFCIASNNTNAGFGGSGMYRCFFANCTAYANGTDGFEERNGSISGSVFVNCLAVSNGAYGFDMNSGFGTTLHNCATYNNTSGATDGTELSSVNAITLSADPFTDAANDDFTLNNTAGGGALVREAGIGPAGLSSGIDVNGLIYQRGGGGGTTGRQGLHAIETGGV